MATLIQEMNLTGSFDEVRDQFAQEFNLDSPIPEEVVHRALSDDLFAHYLWTVKKNPKLLQVLFNDSKNKNFLPQKSEKSDHSNTQLVKKAAESLLKWGRSGFKTVDKETLEVRWNACLGCDLLVDPPEIAAYRIVNVTGGDQRICAGCGCVAKRKCKLTTESCPKEDLERPGFNRWGEVMN